LYEIEGNCPAYQSRESIPDAANFLRMVQMHQNLAEISTKDEAKCFKTLSNPSRVSSF
jgi:hypothetical protein